MEQNLCALQNFSETEKVLSSELNTQEIIHVTNLPS